MILKRIKVKPTGKKYRQRTFKGVPKTVIAPMTITEAHEREIQKGGISPEPVPLEKEPWWRRWVGAIASEWRGDRT